MKASYNWLRYYVNTGWSAETIADRLTMSGLEVEGVERIGQSLEGVVIGKVVDRQQHPNADRLSLCKVDVGGDELLQIVCGAPNVAAGQVVPVATVGTVLNLPSRKEPGVFTEITIKRSKIRNEYSEGMICAEDEVGLTSEPRDGILVLDDDAPIGSSFADYLEHRGLTTNDSVIDISITPNRPDATSHIGVARDLAALADTPLLLPAVDTPTNSGDVNKHISVSIESTDACSRFVGMVVENVTIAPSPVWLQRRLEAIGLRPRNNVVDVTNFVMHECGQPLHGYDLDTLEDATIVVRKTDTPTTFTTLDDKERNIPAGTLMIRDGKRAIGIAGVMGGQNTEVSGKTTRVLIESAYFDPSTIRKAAKALGLQTDASYRFERGVDPLGQTFAAARAALLIAELGSGSIVDGVIDENPVAYQSRSIDLRLARIERILGASIPASKVRQLLEAIGFKIDALGADVFRCEIPSFRPDIEREIDVIEEVARLYGYDQIPEPTTTAIPNFVPTERPKDAVRTLTIGRLNGAGFREIVTNSILSGDDAEYFNHATLYGRDRGDVVHTANAISSDMSALRPTLLASALPVVAHNLNHGQPIVRFVDIGSVFNRSDEPGNTIEGYREHEALNLVVAGNWNTSSFDNPARSADYFDLKGTVADLLAELGLTATFTSTTITEVAEYAEHVQFGQTVVGTIGKVNAETASRFGIDCSVFFAELDWTRLVKKAGRKLRRRYTPVSKYPVVDRDIAVLVDRSVEAGALLAQVDKEGSKLLLESGIFDVYTGKGVPDDKKSIAISMRFGADRTLQDKEVDSRVAKVVKALEDQFGAELRK